MKAVRDALEIVGRLSGRYGQSEERYEIVRKNADFAVQFACSGLESVNC